MKHFQEIWNAGSWFDQRILVPKHGWVTQTTHVSNNGLTWRRYTYMNDDVLKKEFSRYALRLASILQPPYCLRWCFSRLKFHHEWINLKKQLGTNVPLDETKCDVEESDQNHKRCGQTYRSKVNIGQSLAWIGGF